MYSSTCFGHSHAHHQELNNCSSSLWFYRWSVEVAVLLVVVGPVVLEELLHLVGWFILIVWWCTDLQNLKLHLTFIWS